MQRSTTPWICFLRITLGLLWLFELMLGRWWKIGLTEGPHPGWLGPEAGAELTQMLERVLEQGAGPWVHWLIEQVLIPHAETWSVALVVLECAFVVSFILGILVRPVALIGLLVAFVAVGVGVTRIYSLFAVGHLFLLWTGGGHALSIDGLLVRKLRYSSNVVARALMRVLSMRMVPRGGLLVLASLALLGALFLIMQPMGDPARFVAVAHIELAALLGVIAAGIFIAHNLPSANVSVPIDLVRIFIGFKLIQEIFVWTSVDKFGLPGWATPVALARMVEDVAAHHWPPIAECIQSAVLPYIEVWAVGFAIVQTFVGVLLLLGWRSRTMAAIGTVMVLALVVLGFTRMGPLVLVYLVFLFGAGSGRVLALDATGLGGRGVVMPLAWPWWAGIITGLAAVGLIVLMQRELGGVVTDGYHQTLPGFVALLLALPLIALTLAAWFKQRKA